MTGKPKKVRMSHGLVGGRLRRNPRARGKYEMLDSNTSYVLNNFLRVDIFCFFLDSILVERSMEKQFAPQK